MTTVFFSYKKSDNLYHVNIKKMNAEIQQIIVKLNNYDFDFFSGPDINSYFQLDQIKIYITYFVYLSEFPENCKTGQTEEYFSYQIPVDFFKTINEKSNFQLLNYLSSLILKKLLEKENITWPFPLWKSFITNFISRYKKNLESIKLQTLEGENENLANSEINYILSEFQESLFFEKKYADLLWKFVRKIYKNLDEPGISYSPINISINRTEQLITSIDVHSIEKEKFLSNKNEKIKNLSEPKKRETPKLFNVQSRNLLDNYSLITLISNMGQLSMQTKILFDFNKDLMVCNYTNLTHFFRKWNKFIDEMNISVPIVLFVNYLNGHTKFEKMSMSDTNYIQKSKTSFPDRNPFNKMLGQIISGGKPTRKKIERSKLLKHIEENLGSQINVSGNVRAMFLEKGDNHIPKETIADGFLFAEIVSTKLLNVKDTYAIIKAG